MYMWNTTYHHHLSPILGHLLKVLEVKAIFLASISIRQKNSYLTELYRVAIKLENSISLPFKKKGKNKH